jgi:GTP pyrophosphokinase
MNDANVRFSKCCSPIPGDEIVVYVTRGRGMTLHRSDCVNIRNMNEDELVRVMSAEWNVPETMAPAIYHVGLLVRCENRKGLLNDIWKVITDMNITADHFNVRKVNDGAVFDIEVEVANAAHLEKLCKKISQVRSVNDVQRVHV